LLDGLAPYDAIISIGAFEHFARPGLSREEKLAASRALAELLAKEGISHRTIPPRMPKRNGKVERYQQTLKREWGLGQRYRSSEHRAMALPHWLHHYNHTRRHSSIGNRPPISRVRDVLRHDS